MDHGLTLGLEGKHALVTGGSRGVGRATALLLARAGAHVGIGYRSRRAEAERVVEELRALGVQAWAQAADLATPEGAETLFRRADEAFPALDVFVGNAGVWPPRDVPLAEMTDAQWERTVAANLHSVFYTTRLAARRLGAGASIVLVSSTAGQRGEAGHADYASTKGAILSLVKGVAVELAPRGVTVNCVAPGWVDTEMIALPYAGEGRRRIERGIPLGQVATPEEIAGPILFLCSSLARHVTGEILNVNGGSVLCG